MFDVLKSKLGPETESEIHYDQPGKKRKYIISKMGQQTVVESKISITELGGLIDGDILGSCSANNKIDGDNLQNLVESVCENYIYNETGDLDPKTRKKRLNFYTERDFETDKMIVVHQSSTGVQVNGIILDLHPEDDFIDANRNGVECDMPSYFRYLESSEEEKDGIDDEFFYQIQSDFEKLVRRTIEKVSACREATIQGLYVIINGRVYYLTSEEYLQMQYDLDNALIIESEKDLSQLSQQFITDEDVFTNTLQIINNHHLLLSEKESVDLNSIEDIGTDIDSFISGMVLNDEKTYQLLESRLKSPKTSVARMNM